MGISSTGRRDIFYGLFERYLRGVRISLYPPKGLFGRPVDDIRTGAK